MKKIIVLSSVVALLSACGGSGNGELIGVENRQIWNPTDPYGMVFIPQGSYNMGPSDQDVPFANVSQSKTVSVGAFYMDETEITNNEYRQFTNWVRDSILRQYLIANGATEYGTEVMNYTDETGTGVYRIDWTKKIRWDDPKVREILEQEEMFLPENERLDGQREFDTRKFVYKYQVLDIQSAAVKSNREKDRRGFLSYVDFNIYPDTLTWTHDYSYSFNDPTTKNYFWHPAFSHIFG